MSGKKVANSYHITGEISQQRKRIELKMEKGAEAESTFIRFLLFFRVTNNDFFLYFS